MSKLTNKQYKDYAPIVKVAKNTYKVYLTSYIEEPSAYNKLFNLLYTANHNTSIELIINNGGGVLDSAFQIIDQIKTSKAKVTASLYGTVASAATIIALACDDIYVSGYTQFMVHSASGGFEGKMHESKAYMEFSDKLLNKLLRTVYTGFLTEDEIVSVIDGKDMWMNSEEVIKRWTEMKGTDNEDL